VAIRGIMQKKQGRIRSGTLLIIVGLAAIAAAAAIWFYNDQEERRVAEFSGEATRQVLDIIKEKSPPPGAAGASPGISAPTAPPAAETPDASAPDAGAAPADGTSYVVVGKIAYMGIIKIPKLSIELPVNYSWSYPALKNSPCRYSGSVETNDLVIAAHSYKTHFRYINTLEPGDEVIFTDASGTEYRYTVVTTDVVHPSDTRSVVTSPYDLSLFTCTYDSRSRTVVRCMMDT